MLQQQASCLSFSYHSLLSPNFRSILFSQSVAYLQEGRTDLNLLTQTELNTFKLINIESKTIKHSKDSLRSWRSTEPICEVLHCQRSKLKIHTAYTTYIALYILMGTCIPQRPGITVAATAQSAGLGTHTGTRFCSVASSKLFS